MEGASSYPSAPAVAQKGTIMAELSKYTRAKVQPHLTGIKPYDPSFTPTRINLSANENTYPLPKGVRAAVDKALAATPLNRYPDPMANDLRDKLAALHGVERENICVGNGGDELLFNFLLAFGGEGRRMLNFPPSFSEYEFFASLTKTSVRNVRRDRKTFAIDERATLAAAPQASLAILTSPNNPTGDVADPAFVAQLCRQCGGPVMIDEAYIEFADQGKSMQSLLSSCPNLVILHTLSKAFGAAGIRCGYVIAAPDIIDVFGAVRQIYSVNVLTQAAAGALVSERDAFEPVVAQIRSERERLARKLEEDERLTVWPSQGNFLLVRMDEASTIRQRLRDEYSILVRDFSDVPSLNDCLRITVGTPEENDELLAALAVLLDEEA